MKAIYYVLNFFSFTFLFLSCSEERIERFAGNNYLYFENQIVNYSFVYNPQLVSLEIPFPVKLIGNSAKYDRKMNVVLDTASENLSGTDYEILSPVFRKGMLKDTIYVRIHKSEKLKYEELSLIIRIEESEDFLPGPPEAIRALLNFSDQSIRPEWWDSGIEEDYLGVYSEKKLRLLITITGISDWSELGISEKRSYAIMMANYIRENYVTEDDGSPMIVTVKY